MSERKDGGPAFPVCPDTSTGHAAAFRGMTLRDWFAGQAIAGLMGVAVPRGPTPSDPAQFAFSAYRLADAMIAARDA